MTLQRSNIEGAKRVFLDRLTTDAQPLLQPDKIDEGPGEEYEYGGVGDSNNFGVGFDCSGLNGIVLAIALNGFGYFAGKGYFRLFSTETFPGPLQGFRQVSKDDCLNSNYPIRVFIMHGGGGPDSHMACEIDGWWMESNGDHGVCTDPGDINPPGSGIWNDWWVFDGPIVEDTTYRQPMGYPQGLDYAGGRISGADLAAAGISFVCRYVTDGGGGLPQKLITPAEFYDLVSNGIAVVFNWESTANAMLGGYNQGAADAQQALSTIGRLLDAARNGGIGIPDGYRPVVYFSCDFDEAPNQDQPVEEYLQGAANVLGGMDFVGLYGSYYICTRARAAVGVKYLWQTQAWSGGNVTSDVNIVQRNAVGYRTVGGVQCDVDEAHSGDFGQFQPARADAPTPDPTPDPTPTPAPAPSEAPDYGELAYEQLAGIIDPATGYGRGWPQLAGDPAALKTLQQKIDAGVPLYLVDAIAADMYDLTASRAQPAPKPAVVTPNAAPPAPAPAVVPVAPVVPAAPTKNPLKQTPASYLHAATTLLGGVLALGTYLVGHHIVSGAVAAGIASAVLAGTSWLDFLVKAETKLEGTQKWL